MVKQKLILSIDKDMINQAKEQKINLNSKTEIPKYFLYVRPMSRRKVTLRLNNDVVERAKNAGMNLSYFLEVKLVEYLLLDVESILNS